MELKPIARRVNMHEGTDLGPHWLLLGPDDFYGDGFTHEALYSGEQVAALRAVVDAAQEWHAERSLRDWSEADLMKALWTFNGDNTEPCPECDGECGEPCAPCTVVAAHAAIDAALDDLVKRGKLYRGESFGA